MTVRHSSSETLTRYLACGCRIRISNDPNHLEITRSSIPLAPLGGTTDSVIYRVAEPMRLPKPISVISSLRKPNQQDICSQSRIAMKLLAVNWLEMVLQLSRGYVFWLLCCHQIIIDTAPQQGVLGDLNTSYKSADLSSHLPVCFDEKQLLLHVFPTWSSLPTSTAVNTS